MINFKNLTRIAVFSFFVSWNCQAQDAPIPQESKKDDKVYTNVQSIPEFPGGMAAFYSFIGKNYKIPPTFNGTGTVILNYIVEKDGNLTDIKVVRDAGSGTGEEAVRILKLSPKWKPGQQDGVPVRVAYSLPIKLNK